MESDDENAHDGENRNYVYYADREEWSDVVPVPQNDGPFSVVKIAYKPTFSDVYDYFRAVVAKGELSERALKLTEDAIQMNPANYTVWQYRRKILKHLKRDLNEELTFCQDMIDLNPKNYQVWHHRRVIVEWLEDPSKELQLTEMIFAQDAKNYHAWEHRQWVLKTFSLFDKELSYVDELLQDDVRNNSAWNQRFFVVSHTTRFTEDAIQREAAYAMNAIRKVVNNESPWSYLRGVLQMSCCPLSEWTEVKSFVEGLYQEGERSPHLLLFLIEVKESCIEETPELRDQELPQMLQLCEKLATEYDKIRKEYWKYLQRRLSEKFKKEL